MRSELYSQKGHVHIHFGSPLEPMDDVSDVVHEIDRQIQTSYHHWPVNHAAVMVARDMTEYRDEFDTLDGLLSNNGDVDMDVAYELMGRLDTMSLGLQKHIVDIYVNPLINQARYET